MKNNKGISLISLAVIVFIMLLLSSITIVSSRDAYSVIKTQNFISKMKIIQAKVDDVSEISGVYVPQYGTKINNVNNYTDFGDIINELKAKDSISSWDSSSDEDLTNYYYFEPEDLYDEFGIKDVNLTVIINFNTRNVIALKGVRIDGVTYYREYDIDSGENLMS